MARELTEVALERFRQCSKITEQEDLTSRARNPRQAQKRTLPLELLATLVHGLPEARFSQHTKESERGSVSEPGAEFELLTLGENKPAQAITIGNRTPRDKSRSLRRPDRLIGATGCEHHGLAQIQPDNDRTVALLPKNFGMCLSSARGNTPIDRTQIIARLVRSRLVKFHPSALESGQMPP
jgi:hypothetical protein